MWSCFPAVLRCFFGGSVLSAFFLMQHLVFASWWTVDTFAALRALPCFSIFLLGIFWLFKAHFPLFFLYM